MSAFVESYGTIPERDDNEYLADAGITFLIMNNLQFDLSGGIGLNKAATDNFISFGISCRLPR